MNAVIFTLTLRQLLGRRRVLMLLGLAALPVIVALVFRAGDYSGSHTHWTAQVLLNGLVVTTVLPLTALMFGTDALGMEMEDGTAVYLLSKPLSRLQVIGAKLVAAWLPTAVLVSISTAVSAAIALEGTGNSSILVAFTLAGVLGSFAYCCVFLALSLMTSRALIAGLIYVFLWEGVVTQLFTGTRVLSVRQYTLGLADLVARTDTRTFHANLDGMAAIVLMALVSAAAIALARDRLARFEIRGG